MDSSFTVGTKVRVTRGALKETDTKRFTGKAIISTIDEDDAGVQLASLITEGIHPQISGRLSRFLISPHIPNEQQEYEELDGIRLDRVQHLRLFELTDRAADSEEETNPATWKKRGDELFRLGDFRCATECYEAALSCAPKVNVGATVIIGSDEGLMVAEVDCIEEDDIGNVNLDVTYNDGKEEVISEKKVSLVVFQNGEIDRLQERILLNLSRCLLSLADITSERDYGSFSAPKYRTAAVVACSLSLACSGFYSSLLADSSIAVDYVKLEENARLLRVRAYLGMQEFRLALIDCNQVLKRNPRQKDASHLVARIKKEAIARKKADRNLAKKMCSWIQETSIFDCDSKDKTGQSVSDGKKRSNGRGNENEKLTTSSKRLTQFDCSTFLPIFALILPLVLIGIHLL